MCWLDLANIVSPRKIKAIPWTISNVKYIERATVSQEQFQPMMWCTRDFIFENLLSQPYVQK